MAPRVIDIEVIRSSDLVKGWPEAAISDLIASGVFVDYPAKTFLGIALQPVKGLHLIVTGSVRVTAPGAEGLETLIGMGGPRRWIGLSGTLDNAPYLYTTTASARCRALFIPKERFRSMLKAHPDVCLALLARLTTRIRQGHKLAGEKSGTSPRSRLIAKLLSLARQYGLQTADGVAISLPLRQEDLAQLVGASRQRVNEQLSRLSKLGLIESTYRHITIRDVDRLAKLLDEAQAPECALDRRR